jgi:hypothetical protein
VSEERPPEEGLPRTKGRLPFDTDRASGKAFKTASLLFYAVLVAGLIGLALYMALVVGHPLASAYVAGPAIGALWFGLRLFMIWGSKG